MTRKLLLDSALQAFQAKGYADTTVDEIAVGAGTTRTTFYLHFASKAELVGALIGEIKDRIITSDVPPLPEVVASGDREQLRTWLSRRFDQWPDIMPYVIIADQAIGVEPDVGRRIEEWHDNPISEIAEGLTLAGRFAPEERRLRAMFAFAQMEYLSRRWARLGWGNGVERDQALEALTESLYRQLVTDAE